MSAKTGIAWTDATFNPWWGCVRVSPGCELCYAERDSKRYGFKLWGPGSPRRFFGDKHWNAPRKWNRDAIANLGRPARVFCASMADVFEDRRDLDEPRARLFRLIEETPDLRWQVLTKRPQNAARLVPETWRAAWPSNAWALVTAEDQQRADERIPILLTIPARVRGVSYEPALGPVDFRPWMAVPEPVKFQAFSPEARAVYGEGLQDRTLRVGPAIDWIIAGGESGGRDTARPMARAWVDSAVIQCRAAGIPPFVKQMGRWVLGDHEGFDVDHWMLPGGRAFVPPILGPLAGVRPAEAIGFSLAHPAGADPAEWPEDLRAREFPS